KKNSSDIQTNAAKTATTAHQTANVNTEPHQPLTSTEAILQALDELLPQPQPARDAITPVEQQAIHQPEMETSVATSTTRTAQINNEPVNSTITATKGFAQAPMTKTITPKVTYFKAIESNWQRP